MAQLGKFNQFDKVSLPLLRDEMKKSLATLEQEYGIKFEIGKIKYSAQLASIGVSCTVNSTDGSVVSPYEISFKRNAIRRGFNLEDLGAVITSSKGEYCKIVGWKKGGKYNVVASRENGVLIRFTPAFALKALGRKDPMEEFSSLFRR